MRKPTPRFCERPSSPFLPVDPDGLNTCTLHTDLVALVTPLEYLLELNSVQQEEKERMEATSNYIATIPLPAEVMVRLRAAANSHVEIVDDNARRPVFSCSENCLPVLLVPFGSSWMKQFSCPSKEQKRMQQNHSTGGTSKNRWDTTPSSASTFERTKSLRRITSDSSVLASARSFIPDAPKRDAPRRYTSMEYTGSPQSLRKPKPRDSEKDGGDSNSNTSSWRDGDNKKNNAEWYPEHASATSTLASHFHPSLMPGGIPKVNSSQTSQRGSPRIRKFKHMDSFLLNVKKPYFYAPDLEEEASSAASSFRSPRKPSRSQETLNLPQHKYENGDNSLAQSTTSHGNASWDNMPATAPCATRKNNTNCMNLPQGTPRSAMSSAMSDGYSSSMGSSGLVNSNIVVQKLPDAWEGPSSFAAIRQTVSEQSLTSLMGQNKNSQNSWAPGFPNPSKTGPTDFIDSQRLALHNKRQNSRTNSAVNSLLAHQLSGILEVDGDELDEFPRQATLGVPKIPIRGGTSGNNNNSPLQNVFLGGPNNTATPFFMRREDTSVLPSHSAFANQAISSKQPLECDFTNKSELSDTQRQAIRELMNKASAQSGKSASLQNALASHPSNGVPAFGTAPSRVQTHPMVSTATTSMLNNSASQFLMPDATPTAAAPQMPCRRSSYDKSDLSEAQSQAVQELMQAKQSPQETSPSKAHAAPQMPRRRASNGTPDLSEAQRQAVRELMLGTTATSSRPHSFPSTNHQHNAAPQMPHRRESKGAPDLSEAQRQAVRELMNASCLHEGRLEDGLSVTSIASEQVVSDPVLTRQHGENVVDAATANPQEAKEMKEEQPRPLPSEEDDDMEAPPVSNDDYGVEVQTKSANEEDETESPMHEGEEIEIQSVSSSNGESNHNDDVDSCCEFSNLNFDLDDTSVSSEGSVVDIFGSSRGFDILGGSSDAYNLFGESSTTNILSDSVVLSAEDTRETCAEIVAESDTLSANSQPAQLSEQSCQCHQDSSGEGPVSGQHSPNNSTSNTTVDDSSAHDSDGLGELPLVGTASSEAISNISQDCNHRRRPIFKKSLSMLSFRGREESEETEQAERTRPKLVRKMSAPLINEPSRGLLRRLSSRAEQKNRRKGLTKSLSFRRKHVRDPIAENNESEPTSAFIPPGEVPSDRQGVKRTTSMGARLKNRLSKIAGKSLPSKNLQKSEVDRLSLERVNPIPERSNDDSENNSENRESHSSPKKRRSSNESVSSSGIGVSPMVSKSMNFAQQVVEVDDENNVLSVDKNPGPILVPLVPS